VIDGNPGMVARLPNIREEEEEEEENMDDGTPGVDADIEEEEEEEEGDDGTPGVDVNIKEEEDEDEEEPNEEIALDGARSSSHNLCPRRGPSEECRRAMQPQDNNSHLHAILEH
jgi:hypothetical protein